MYFVSKHLLIFIYFFIICMCYIRIPLNPLLANFFELLYVGGWGAGKGSLMKRGVHMRRGVHMGRGE